MSHRQPGKEPHPARQPAVEQRPRSGQTTRREGDAGVPAALTLAISLMNETARTEWDVAETLESLAAQAGVETAARRRRLARDATDGAQAALKRSDQLQQLARRWAEREDIRILQHLLQDAADGLTGLAHLEQSIADTFASLAGQDESGLAAERRQMAAAAAAQARSARDRAQDLRRLARTRAAGGSGSETAAEPDPG